MLIPVPAHCNLYFSPLRILCGLSKLRIPSFHCSLTLLSLDPDVLSSAFCVLHSSCKVRDRVSREYRAMTCELDAWKNKGNSNSIIRSISIKVHHEPICAHAHSRFITNGCIITAFVIGLPKYSEQGQWKGSL